MAAMAFTCKQFYLSRLHALNQSHNSRPREAPLTRISLPLEDGFPASHLFHVPYDNRASRFSPVAASRTQPTALRPEDSDRIPERKRRGRNPLPPRLQKISMPLPESPNYYLWAAGILLVYVTRHAIANELIQWTTIAAAIGLTLIRFVCRVLWSALQYAVQLLHVPLAFVVTLFVRAGMFTGDIYTIIVSTTSVRPTLQAIVLGTTVLSLGEAVRSTAVSGQPWTILIATLLGVGAVFEVFHHTVFVFLLLLSVIYASLVQKKDAVSAFMPGTALLVAIAEPSLKAVAFVSFLALSMYTYWKHPEERAVLVDNKKTIVQPAIMVVAAMALGLTVASRYLSACQVRWLAKQF